MLEGSGSVAGSVPRTNGSRSGRPKNIRILRIRLWILISNIGAWIKNQNRIKGESWWASYPLSCNSPTAGLGFLEVIWVGHANIPLGQSHCVPSVMLSDTDTLNDSETWIRIRNTASTEDTEGNTCVAWLRKTFSMSSRSSVHLLIFSSSCLHTSISLKSQKYSFRDPTSPFCYKSRFPL
jgi:hypothetical protein